MTPNDCHHARGEKSDLSQRHRGKGGNAERRSKIFLMPCTYAYTKGCSSLPEVEGTANTLETEVQNSRKDTHREWEGSIHLRMCPGGDHRICFIVL